MEPKIAKAIHANFADTAWENGRRIQLSKRKSGKNTIDERMASVEVAVQYLMDTIQKIRKDVDYLK